MVFLPHLQEKVDFHVATWNRHRVRRINENGRFRGSHVPTRYFRKYERLQGYVTTVHTIANYDYNF